MASARVDPKPNSFTSGASATTEPPSVRNLTSKGTSTQSRLSANVVMNSSLCCGILDLARD